MDNKLTDSILSCSDLFVILKSRYGGNFIESYYLSNILYSSEKFWGKFRNIHTADTHRDIKNTALLSYAYNNFSDVVCSSSLPEKLERYYSSHAYSSLKFITKNKYIKIWNSHDLKDIAPIRNAINNGRKLKVKIEDKEGYIYIIPAHTVEVHDNGSLSFETEYDGYPERLRYFQSVQQIDHQFKSILDKIEPPNYPASSYDPCQFYLTSFIRMINGDLIHRSYQKGSDNFHHEKFNFKTLELWSEI